jgi:hypothetical protein
MSVFEKTSALNSTRGNPFWPGAGAVAASSTARRQNMNLEFLIPEAWRVPAATQGFSARRLEMAPILN